MVTFRCTVTTFYNNCLAIGFQWEFLQIEVLRASWQTITGIITSSLVMPAVTEELFFRVLLLPKTTENLSTSAL
jgi:predicted Abi (CAAX) family protease